MNNDGNLLGATDNATELTASLCEKYNIPVANIVQHNKWTGKNCPQMIREGKPYDWDTFISKVQAFMWTSSVTPTAPPAPVPEMTGNIKVGDIVLVKTGAKSPFA